MLANKSAEAFIINIKRVDKVFLRLDIQGKCGQAKCKEKRERCSFCCKVSCICQNPSKQYGVYVHLDQSSGDVVYAKSGYPASVGACCKTCSSYFVPTSRLH